MEVEATCDDCGSEINTDGGRYSRSEVYCIDCHQVASDALEGLQDQIQSLEETIAENEGYIEELRRTINLLEASSV